MIREIRYTKNNSQDVLDWDVVYVNEEDGIKTITDLEGGEYYVTTRIDVDGAKSGWGDEKSTIVLPMQLQSPQDLSVKEKYSNYITLQWDQVPNAKQLIIDVDTGSGYSNLANIDGTLMEYTHKWLDSGTEYHYRIKAIGDGSSEDYLDSDYSYISVVTNLSSILLEDDFTGTTINLTKHLVSNPNPSGIVISQNDELILETTGLENININPVGNRVRSRTSKGSLRQAIAFDVNLDINLAVSPFQMYGQIMNPTATQWASLAFNGEFARLIILNINEQSSGTLYDFLSGVTINNKRWKIFKDIDSISFYYWDTGNSQWVQVGATVNTIFDKSLHHNFTVNASDMGQSTLRIDNLYVSDDNYNTLYPA